MLCITVAQCLNVDILASFFRCYKTRFGVGGVGVGVVLVSFLAPERSCCWAYLAVAVRQICPFAGLVEVSCVPAPFVNTAGASRGGAGLSVVWVLGVGWHDAVLGSSDAESGLPLLINLTLEGVLHFSL